MALPGICLFLSLIFPAFSSTESPKLIVFAGIPSSLDGWKPSGISWDACLSQCWYDPDCRVVFQNTSTCYVMKRGNITIQPSKDSVNRVAVKIPDTPADCLPKPSDYFNQPFTETRNESQIIRSQFSYSNGQYRVVYTVSICPNTTDLYTRVVDTKTYQVCVGFRTFDAGSGTFYDAQKLCKEDGGYGLSGPLDGDEYAILKEKGIALRKQNGQDRTAFFWIDGFNPTWGQFIYEDESHNGDTDYPWQNGDPNDTPPSAFFMLGVQSGQLIGDYTETCSSAVGYPFLGALCRVNDVLLQD